MHVCSTDEGANRVRNRKSSIGNLDDLCLHVFTFNDQFSHADGQLEPSRARAARIQIEHAVACLLLRNVTVSGDDNSETRRFGLQIQLPQIVEHIHRSSSDFNDLNFRQFARPRAFVDVAAHGGERSDLQQSVENLRIAYITGMNDVIGAA